MSIKIRTMTVSDYDSVYRLWTNTPGMGLNNLDDSRDGIARYLKRNPTTCFVAENDNAEIIGIILCGHDGRRGYIHHTAVKVSERKKGIGAALVNAAVAALQNEDITKAALVVFASNELGNGFWERLGFITREDLNYRNKTLDENLIRMDT
ncbi:N-acetyltransferase [Clostridia bacterium]|nr:N-acetyltransferase [Clostridia bacterium]